MPPSTATAGGVVRKSSKVTRSLPTAVASLVDWLKQRLVRTGISFEGYYIS